VTKSQVGLGNVGNFKAVSTVASQDLTDTEKSNARANIGLGSLATKSSLAASDIPTITKSKISDFPQSMPASDVSAWAKAANKPNYTLDEVSDGTNKKWGDKIGKTIETTYANLKSLRDNSQLIPGQWYRITDYVTTTIQENTQSAGHAFDIIVTADDESTLNENARAIIHSGDTYFTTAGAKLNAWELKYSLENDTDKFAWADSTNGKGVIYWMKDEWNNECPYDFKNIQFKRFKIEESTKCPDLEGLYAIDGATDVTVDTGTTYWSYTFCMYDLGDSAPCDVSTYQDKYLSDENYYPKTYNNVFKSYLDEYEEAMKLPDNVFITDTDICAIEENYGEFYGFNGNTFGNDCQNNTFGNCCRYNTFGNYCYYNTFGNDCGSNAFGDYCYNNTFGNSCLRNTFGNTCCGNTFENICWNNTFGNCCSYNTFENNCWNNIVENGNQYITLTSTQTTSSSALLRNITIAQGVNNTTTTKTISHNTVNDTFQTVYQPANSQVISV